MVITVFFPRLFGPILLFLLGAVPQTLAHEISAATAEKDAILGSAYKSEQETFPSQACFSGDKISSGAATSTFSFEQSLTEAQASRELGFGAGGRARYGVVEASASARFLKNSISNEYSVSAVWLSEYRLPTDKLSNPKLSPIGESVQDNFERWAITCGDEYVTEITRGARLFFSIRIDFSSREEKQKFEAEFSLSGPLFSAQADMNQSSREFSRGSRVTISALQVGGDVSKVTALFEDTDQKNSGFVQCTLGDFAKCTDVVSAALTYATDVGNGFPSQIAPGATPGAAPLIYRSEPYSSAGVFIQDYPGLNEATKQARERLSDEFEKNLKLSILADRLIEIGVGQERILEIVNERSKIDSNVEKALSASKICYNRPEYCSSAVSTTDFVSINQAVFTLPPAITGAFVLMNIEKGVWDRNDSVSMLQSCKDHIYEGWNCNIWDFTINDAPVSAGLRIYGASVVEANVYFEDRLVKTIPLRLESGSDKTGKRFPDGAILIVQSSRSNPGWVDINVEELRTSLLSEIPKGDGIFYVEIVDAFERVTRFDLEYQKWDYQISSDVSGRTKASLSVFMRNRWWDPSSGGATLTGVGNWNADSRIKFVLEYPSGKDVLRQLALPFEYLGGFFIQKGPSGPEVGYSVSFAK